MKPAAELRRENRELQVRLGEAEELLAAIRCGAVDAVLTEDQKIFTLSGADHAYRILVETINEGAATLARDGTVTYANGRLAEMAGLPLKKIIGSSVYDRVCADDLPRLKSLMRRGEGTTPRAEIRFKKGDGDLLPVLASCGSLHLPGACWGMLITDLTEQKAVQRELEQHRRHLEDLVSERSAALKESEKRFRFLAEALPQIVWTAGPDGAIEWFNRRWYEYTRAPRAAGEGWTWQKMVHPDDIAPTLRKWAQVQDAPGNYQNSVRIRRSDGRYRWFLVRAYPLRDRKGRIVRWFGTNTDIHDLKQAQEVLARDKRAFQRLVQAGARQLIAKEVELESAKRLSDIGLLAATVAHELRNPLAVISIAASNIRRKVRRPNVVQHLVSIAKKIRESDQIISNLLFYTRLHPPQLVRVDLLPILDEASDVIASMRPSGVSLVRKLDGLEGVAIEADQFQMEEVFSNILGNASDALAAQGGEIEITAKTVEDSVVVTIRDNGQGIPRGDVSKVFEPFFTTKAKGTGLGLYVCQQIVRLHRGSITVESEEGKGTVVAVRLPMAQGVDPRVADRSRGGGGSASV